MSSVWIVCGSIFDARFSRFVAVWFLCKINKMKFFSQPLAGPISELAPLHRSLLFAELARLAYSEESSAASVVETINLTETLFVERDGAQAYVFRNNHDCIVACRGTEPSELNDLKADVDATSVLSETVGRVHRGFKKGGG